MGVYEPKIIKDIQKSYDNDNENWDKKFTFEGIERYRKVNTKNLN